jgi:HK97 family phage prohead protease
VDGKHRERAHSFMAKGGSVMPYYITDKAQDCSGWATIKEDGEVIGCHTTKQGAIDQMVAVSVAENLEPGGERNESGPPAVIADIDNTLITYQGAKIDKVADYLDSFDDTEIIIITARLASQRDATIAELDSLDIDYDQLFMKPDADTDSTEWKKQTAERLLETYNVMVAVDDNEDIRNAYRDLGITAIAPTQVPASSDDEDEEMRAVDLTPPAYMRAAARRGLEFYAEGKGGDGLVDQTIADARRMAQGEVSERKWRLIGPWIARHLVDLDAPSAQPDSPDYPSAGVVAMLLWGAPANRRGAERARAYAEGVVARLDAEQERKASMTNRETRDFETQFEIREEGDGMTFVGYAAKFDQPSENLGGFIEYVERGAFSRSLKSRNDVMLLWNHDAGQPLASTRSGTMKLTEDDIGLRVEARLPQTTLGKDLAILLRDGIVGKMSFGFNVIKDAWNSEGTERRLKSVRLFEVSAVVWPAYTSTSASVRGLDKVAQRASVDADELADVMLKIEEGADLTPDQAELMKSVVERLAPAPEPAVTEEPQPSLLAVKQKQLDLLLKRI